VPIIRTAAPPGRSCRRAVVRSIIRPSWQSRARPPRPPRLPARRGTRRMIDPRRHAAKITSPTVVQRGVDQPAVSTASASSALDWA
jgi:hypothetical protein